MGPLGAPGLRRHHGSGQQLTGQILGSLDRDEDGVRNRDVEKLPTNVAKSKKSRCPPPQKVDDLRVAEKSHRS
jgi:hypothetical protein